MTELMQQDKKRNTIRSYIKRFNSNVLKLSWVYILAISALLVLFVQLYNASKPHTPPSYPSETNLSHLQKQIDEQAVRIQNLEETIKQLQNK